MSNLRLVRNEKNQDEKENVLEGMVKSAFISGLAVFFGKLAIEMLKGIFSSNEVDNSTKEIIRKDLMSGK